MTWKAATCERGPEEKIPQQHQAAVKVVLSLGKYNTAGPRILDMFVADRDAAEDFGRLL